MKEILLCEGKIDFKTTQLGIFKNEHEIFSFDYYSHKSLNDKNIPHKKIEDYFEKEDIKKLEKLALDLTIKWYKTTKIQERLIFEKINLGNLLEIELSAYFLKILKRIFGINKIVEMEKPRKIISYSLTTYLEKLCKENNIELKSLKENIDSELFFDKINIPIDLQFKKTQLQISRKNFFFLKKNFEKVQNKFLKTKIKTEELVEKESILLIDFHTKMYKDFLGSFMNSKYNIILLNQRKPVIWDKESLQIIIKSNCKILTIYDFENKEIKNQINKEQKKMLQNLHSIFNEDICNEIFSIEGISFWHIIKNEFSDMIIIRFLESVKRISLLKKMFEKVKIKHILDWAHVGSEEKEISHFANLHNIPISCLQHGIMTLNPKNFDKYHPIMPVLPSNNSKMMVWGKTMESYLIQHNVDHDKIKIVGSPRHDVFFKKNESIKKSENVLIASNLFFHHNFNGINTETYERYIIFLEKILLNLKLKDYKNPIIKLHTSEKFDIKPIIKKIDPTIPIYQHEDLLPLLESCDSIISLNYSTILLDALILKKPTMVILPEKQNFEQEEIIKENAVLAVSEVSDIELKLKDFFENEKTKEMLRENSEKFISNYFSYQGKSSKYLSEILSK